MRTVLLFLTSAALLPASLQAKGKGGAAAAAKPQVPVAIEEGKKAAQPFDVNFNGKIDGDEIDRLRQFFNAHRDGPLKQYDVNKDGKLDDVEIDAIRFPHETEKKAKKKKDALGR